MSAPTAIRPTTATLPTPKVPTLDLPKAAMSTATVFLTSKTQQSTIDLKTQDSVMQSEDSMDSFSTRLDEKSTNFAEDFSSFFNGSALLANPFAVDDALLDSPLGLESNFSTVSSSPFDLVAGSFDSPAFDFPSLFPDATSDDAAWSARFTQPTTSPSVDASTPDLVVSPQMMTLDTATAPATPTLPELEDIKPIKSLPKRAMSKSKAKPVTTPSSGKDKFTGTRNTKKPPIDYDAPTLPKNYVIPACTSRKLAPQAITSKLSGVKRSRSVEETESPEDIAPELLEAIVDKRRSNTLAARKSRERKAAHLRELEQKIADLATERDSWKQRCQELEQLVTALRG